MDCSAAEYQANLPIPVDLFVSKEKKGVMRGGYLRFTDASGNVAFTVERQSHHKRILVDASSNPILSIFTNKSGSWQGFRGVDCSETNFIFRVRKTLNTVTRTEFEAFLVNEDLEDMKSDFKMKGSPFQRSCTIYRGNAIVAQTSLMYKLGMQKVLVPRNRFRLTIYPGVDDHALIVALVVIFFDGRKIWI